MFFRLASTTTLALVLFAGELSASDVVDLAASLIGRPYVWGAEGPDTFDCSGLTQYVFGEFGIPLPRRAINQSEVGDSVGHRLERGDLVFFSSDAATSVVTHVGVYEGGGLMVNASKRHGRVRRDDLSDPYWSSRFMFARRILGHSHVRTESPEQGEGRRTERNADRRRQAARVFGRLAEALLRRSRR